MPATHYKLHLGNDPLPVTVQLVSSYSSCMHTHAKVYTHQGARLTMSAMHWLLHMHTRITMQVHP
jgi:hypothetical protein